MYKKYNIIILTFIFLIAISMLLFIIRAKTSDNKNNYSIPDLALYNLHDEGFNLKDSTFQKALLLVFVQSDCLYCHEEIALLSDSITAMKNVKVILISKESKAELEYLQELIKTNEILLLSDINGEFSDALFVRQYPSAFLFDKHKSFIKEYKGIIPLSQIKLIMQYE